MTNEEAIKKLQRHKAEYLDKWVDFSGITEALDMAIKALEQESALDEIRDEIKWIPVSEDLPKISDDYIITVFDPVKKYTFVTEACYSVNSGNWESDYLHFWQRVVAWTPLAKPYKKAVEEYEKIIDKINDQYKEESKEEE